MIELWTEARDAAALATAPTRLGGTQDPRYLGVLAAALTTRYQRGDVPARAEYSTSGVAEIVVRRDPADLDRAIEAARNSLAGDPDQPWVTTTLATALALRYERSGDLAELGEALALTRCGSHPSVDASRGALLAWAAHTFATREGVRRDLRGQDLSGRDLTDADLGGADLTGAVLVNADLTGANLAGATLVGARLDGACLVNTVLSGADLTDAWLIGADLTGAHLTAARLDRAVLTRATVDENTLASASIRRAAVTPDAQPRVLTGEDPEDKATVIAATDDLVATGHNDGSIRLWDAGTGMLLHEHRWWGWRPFDETREELDAEDPDVEELDAKDPPWPEVAALVFSPDGNWLAAVQRGAVVDYDVDYVDCYATLLVWHLGTGPLEPALKIDYGAAPGQYQAWDDGMELAFSPDSRSLALGFDGLIDTWDFGLRSDLYVWNLASGNRLWSLTSDAETWGCGIAYSPDNRLVAAGCISSENMIGGQQVGIWRVDTGAPVGRWDTPGQSAEAVAFAGNDRLRAVTSCFRRWSAWEWSQDTDADGKLWEHEDQLAAAAYSPDGQRLAASHFKRMALYDATTGVELWSLDTDLISVFHFSPDGRWLVYGNWYGVHIHDVDTGAALPGDALAVAFVPDGYWAIHLDGSVHLHDTAGVPVRDLDPYRSANAGWQVAGLRLLRPSDLSP